MTISASDIFEVSLTSLILFLNFVLSEFIQPFQFSVSTVPTFSCIAVEKKIDGKHNPTVVKPSSFAILQLELFEIDGLPFSLRGAERLKLGTHLCLDAISLPAHC